MLGQEITILGKGLEIFKGFYCPFVLLIFVLNIVTSQKQKKFGSSGTKYSCPRYPQVPHLLILPTIDQSFSGKQIASALNTYRLLPSLVFPREYGTTTIHVAFTFS